MAAQDDERRPVLVRPGPEQRRHLPAGHTRQVKPLAKLVKQLVESLCKLVKALVKERSRRWPNRSQKSRWQNDSRQIAGHKPPVETPPVKPLVKSLAKPLVKSLVKPLVKSLAKPLAKPLVTGRGRKTAGQTASNRSSDCRWSNR